MNCRRAEELFSDDRESTLTPLIARELHAHRDTCDACQSLYETFQEVTDALTAISVPAADDALAEKIVAAASHAQPSIVTRGPSPRLFASASWLAVAAMLAIGLLFQPPELASDLSRKTSRTARHVYSFAIQTYDQTERWVENLNVLRMTVSVAFEDRLDQLNEQLRDLENAGRRSTPNENDEQSRWHREPEAEIASASGFLTKRSFL